MNNLATNDSTTKNGLTYPEIRAALMLKGITCREIARRAGVSESAVTQTIKSCYRFKGFGVRKVIAEALEMSVDDIWTPAESN